MIRGFLFVTNRLDEVLVSVSRLREACPTANSTLVTDRATIDELYDSPFDVVYDSAVLLPGTSTGDSMGFRVQKLRALRFSPYAETVYLDSDVFACDSFDEDELWRSVGAADVAGVAKGSVVNGGVLAYRNTTAARRMLLEWESRYLRVMSHTRREQPALQEALAWARQNLTGFTYKGLDRTWNCRGVSTCTDGCRAVHDHAVVPSSARLDYTRPCPALSGGHPLVAILGLDDLPPLGERLALLRKHNDAEPCRVKSDDVAAGLDACLAQRARYGVVALAAPLSVPFLAGPVLFAWISHPALLAWARRRDTVERLFTCRVQRAAAQSCAPVAAALLRWFSNQGPEAALTAATTRFAAVLFAEKRLDSFRLLERILPSHFLRLARVASTDGNNERTSFESPTPYDAVQDLANLLSEQESAYREFDSPARSYVTDALHPDTQLYNDLYVRFARQLQACDVDTLAQEDAIFFVEPPSSSRRRRRQHHRSVQPAARGR